MYCGLKSTPKMITFTIILCVVTRKSFYYFLNFIFHCRAQKKNLFSVVNFEVEIIGI